MSTNVTWADGITYSIPAGGEINWASLSNFLLALGNKGAISTVETQSIRVATSSPVAVVAATDCTVVTNLSVAGAVTVNLAAGNDGRIINIVDGKGDAATNLITINRAGTDTINGATSLVLNHNRQSVTLQYSAATTDWKILSSNLVSGTITPADITGVIPPDKGGTGVSNNSASTVTRVGGFAKTETLTGVTSVTYPTAGTLSTLTGTETLASKTLASPTLQTPVQSSYEDFTDISSPAAPGAGVTRFYTKGGNLYQRTSTLAERLVGSGLATLYQASSFTAVAGFNYQVNTTSAAVTVTLPAGSAGAQIQLSDDAGTWATNNVVVTPATGQVIQGLATNDTLTLNLSGAFVLLAWDSTNNYWTVTGSGFQNLALYVPVTRAGIVPAAGLPGRTDATNPASGTVGYSVATGAQNTNFAVTASTWTNIPSGTIVLPAGNHLLMFQGTFGGSITTGGGVAISANSGTTTTDHVEGLNVLYHSAPASVQTSVTIFYRVLLTAQTTFYAKYLNGTSQASAVIRYNFMSQQQ